MGVNENSSNHKDVEQLMGVKPAVTLARREAFGDAVAYRQSP